MKKKYTYHIDLDERGEFRCHIESLNGKIIWEADTEGMEELIEDGFMKHGRDIAGLEDHLKDIGFMGLNVDLVMMKG